MFLNRWRSRPRTAPRPATFRPGLESLDGRIVPNGTLGGTANGAALLGQFGPNRPDVTATRLAVVTRFQADAGTPARVEVVAVDPFFRVDRDYAGTVTLTGTDAAAAGLPATHTFTAADKGRHTFEVTFNTAGRQTLTATDGTISGSRTVTVSPAVVATRFLVVAQSPAEAGSPARVAVVALDASNKVARNYTGTVTLTSSDGAAVLPAAYTFTAADRGQKVFQVTYNTAGAQTVTATGDDGLTGEAAVTVTAARTAVGFRVLTVPRAAAGLPTLVTVAAVDADGRPVKNFTGTVTLSTTDAAAAGLPATYTFTAADKGKRAFVVTFKTTGPQTVTAAGDNLSAGTAEVEVFTFRPRGPR